MMIRTTIVAGAQRRVAAPVRRRVGAAGVKAPKGSAAAAAGAGAAGGGGSARTGVGGAGGSAGAGGGATGAGAPRSRRHDRALAQARGAGVELGLGDLHLDLDLGLAEHHARALGDHDGCRQARAVDERPVGRAEILELDAVVVGADGEVAARDLLVLERHVGVLAADDELADHLDALPGARAGSDDQEGHGGDTIRNRRGRTRPFVEHT